MRELVDHTLQPAALAGEAYLRLAAQHNLDWTNRAQVLVRSFHSRLGRAILCWRGRIVSETLKAV